MNCFDYFFENTYSLKDDLIVGSADFASYNDFYETSCCIAGFLRKKIGQKQNVVLVSQNSSFFIIAYLGILKSGNVCIPLNPAIEQTNFNFILEKTKCNLGFISNQVVNRVETPIETITENGLRELIETVTTDKLEFEAQFDENQLAEIIFTSGSTAEPKGVMLTHKNIIANTTSIIQYLNLTNQDRMLVVLPFFYCYGLSLLHTHIRVGGQLVLNNNFIFLTSTINNINKFKCTGFAGVPSHFQILLRKNDLFKRTVFSTLRYVTQAGGKLPDAFIMEFTEAFPKIDFFVMYGQTEATARLSYLPPEILRKKIGSIGKGIPGVELKVVTPKGTLTSPGEVGEIIAKGDNVMSGYFEDAKETNATLRNGWLYTGDLARTDDEGYIYLTSRKREIIKVGGKRISPKEIEEVITMIPEVIDCTIEAIDDEMLGQAMKAIVVVNEESNEIDADLIKIFCATKLAKYKIPSFIEIRRNLELSATGKKIKHQS